MRKILKGRRQIKKSSSGSDELRIRLFALLILFFGFVITFRLFTLQVLGYEWYNGLALGQHEILEKLWPSRGEIVASDRYKGTPVPLATNRKLFLVFVEPKKIEKPEEVAPVIAELLELPIEDVESKLAKRNDPYEPLKRGVTEEIVEKIKEQNITGLGFTEIYRRFYPEKNIAAHIVGFVGEDEEGIKGRYGIEEAFDEILKGVQGLLKAEKDGLGRIISIGRKEVALPEKGATVVLTIDRTIQFFACDALQKAVQQHGADGGAVVIVEAKTGKIFAMCSNPDFDPNAYQEVQDLSIFNNKVIFSSWEPGSIFKAITMAAALDREKITPETTYEDKGYVNIPPYTIKNADQKVYGIQDMIGVLKNSINTGAVFAASQISMEAFRRYVEAFGFGEKTGIELPGESKGDISSLSKNGEIYKATASFGQGITVTPLQMVLAYTAIANGGKLFKPYIVDHIVMPDGEIITSTPRLIREVISPKTSLLLKAMLAMVVKEGHGKRAAVKGFTVAGKTGTAQVPKLGGRGYESGVTIGSFIGFAPLDNPVFVMLARIDNPKDVIWAESSAAPLFGTIAKFLLEYLEVPPEKQ